MRILLSIIFAASTFVPAAGKSFDFSEVSGIISAGISNGAFPGAQFIVGTGDGILFESNFGNFTYDEFSAPVTEESIYDLASVTKVIATTSAIMKLYDAGLLDLNAAVAAYIPEFFANGKDEVTVLNLLLHNSGLEAFVPFYTMYDNRDEVLSHIYASSLSYPAGTKTVYSDLNAIILGVLAERVSGMKLDEYCSVNIFVPLGMRTTCFNPSGNLLDASVPTEYDNYWRMKQLKGEVHDEAAYLMGGVSGNAGLFGNAKDLYRFMKAMLNDGKYYDFQTSSEGALSSSETIGLFTKRFNVEDYYNTRALGWETKPRRESSYRIACGEEISEECFGHTGYTGTSIWCDKQRGLIIIFLTNRVYPSRSNNGIREIRPDVHNAAIKAFDSGN